MDVTDGFKYNEALAEKDMILNKLCTNIPATSAWCAKLRAIVGKQIAAGEKPLLLFHRSQYHLDVLKTDAGIRRM